MLDGQQGVTCLWRDCDADDSYPENLQILKKPALAQEGHSEETANWC